MNTSTLIHPLLWGRARWTGLAYGYQEGRPPTLGLAFEGRDAGKLVLREPYRATGPIDTFELIRIAIIEGDIPGEPPGHTVLVTPNFDGLAAKASAEGEPPLTELTMAARFHRIGSTTASQTVGRFKDAFARHRRYVLVGASVSDRSIDCDVTIEKTAIVFKHVSEIGDQDVERLIFARDTRQRRH